MKLIMVERIHQPPHECSYHTIITNLLGNSQTQAAKLQLCCWGRQQVDMVLVLDIPISYQENVDRAMEVLVEICKEMRADPEWSDYLTDDPNMLGVDKFTEYGVIIKLTQQTHPDRIFPVRRELLRRIKNRFDELGFEIPVPQRMVHYPREKGRDVP